MSNEYSRKLDAVAESYAKQHPAANMTDAYTYAIDYVAAHPTYEAPAAEAAVSPRPAADAAPTQSAAERLVKERALAFVIAGTSPSLADGMKRATALVAEERSIDQFAAMQTEFARIMTPVRAADIEPDGLTKEQRWERIAEAMGTSMDPEVNAAREKAEDAAKLARQMEDRRIGEERAAATALQQAIVRDSGRGR